jgi:protein-disulfide isomerase
MALFCLSASCKKEKGAEEETRAFKDSEKTFDNTEPSPEERKPVLGVDTSKLEKPMQVRFESLLDTLPSPCGKAHSLRTSRNNDPTCKRAPFGVDYAFELIKDGASVNEVKELYALRFGDTKAIDFTYDSATPHQGPTDAPVKLVEFYDYGCPACSRMQPVIEEALADFETDVVIYYKQFPLSAHPDSPGAAQAALVANKQGKFKAMHALLFSNQHSHKMDDLKGYAKEAGLNLDTLEADMAAAKAAVEADKAEGDKAGVHGTPALYINGRSYEGPSAAKYLKMWIKESLAKAI